MPSASVIIRSQDSARTIRAAIESVRHQTVDVELIVIDSGSRDETLAIAKASCDQLLQIPLGTYVPARALNLAASAASGEILIPVSSHCELPRTDWIEIALAHYQDERVGAACGTLTDHEGRRLQGTLLLRPDGGDGDGDGTNPFLRQVRRDPAYAYWGFSNHSASWRRTTWEENPFDEGVGAVEDKEWAWRIIDAGWTVAFDPLLVVPQSHRWRAGTLAYFRRERRENGALARILDLPEYGLTELAQEWWQVPDDDHGRLFHLLNPRRAAGLAGKYAGRRR
ncbi:MAG: glycosyltransferase [Solirubrobacterales bacterium]